MSRTSIYIGERARWAAAYLNWEAQREIYTPDGDGFWALYSDQPRERPNQPTPMRISDERIIQAASSDLTTSGVFEEWVSARRSKALTGATA